MNEIKTIVSVPWADNENSWKAGKIKVTSTDQAYSKVPLIFHAVRLRVNTLSRIPVKVYQGDNEIESYYFEDSLPLASLLAYSELSMLLTGAAYNLKLENQFGFKRGLQYLNPYSMQNMYSNGELLYWQQLPTGERYPSDGSFWRVEDFLFFREFNPLSDLGAGVSSTMVALDEAQILKSLSKFLADFFSADALPVTIVTMASGTSETERKRVESWFQKKMRGLREAASRVLGITGDVKLEKLTAELKSFEIEKIDNHAVEQVAHAFEIPKVVLTSQDQNFATAKSEYRKFLEGTIIPRANYYATEINKVLAEFDQHIEFDPQEMPEFQEEEAARAASLNLLVDSGVPLEAALEILGYDLSDEAEAILQKKFTADALPPKAPEIQAPPLVPVNVAALNPTQDQIQSAQKSATIELEKRAAFERRLNKILETHLGNQRKELEATISLARPQETKHEPINIRVDSPIVNVESPRQEAPIVNVHLAKNEAPKVNVSLPEMKPQINVHPSELKAGSVTVNVPRQKQQQITINTPAPIVNVENVVNVPPAAVEVKVPEAKPINSEIVRDEQGRITQIREK